MAKKWREVEQSEGFKKLSSQEQSEAKQEYFDSVVAPQVPEEDRGSALNEFMGSVKQPTPPASPSPDIYQSSPNVHPLITASVISPLVEVTRGLYQGSSSFWNAMDAGAKLVERIMPWTTRGGLFEQFAKSQEQIAESLPDTRMPDLIKIPYQIAGGIIPTLAEFGIAAKVPKIGTTMSGQMSLIGALEEYQKNPELNSLTVGAAKGATVGMSFEIAGRGLELLWKAGKDAARSYISFVTHNDKLADDFVTNPSKYNVSIFKKTKPFEDIKSEFKDQKELISNQFTIEKNLFNEKIAQKKQLLDLKLQDAKANLTNAHTLARQTLQDKQKLTLDDLTNMSSETIANANKALQEKAVTVYDSALTKYKLIKKEAGEQVELSIKEVLEKDPLVRVPERFIENRFNKIILEKAPFQEVKGIFTQRTKAGMDANDAKKFNDIVSEFRTKLNNGDLTLGYLQYFKKDTRELAANSFSAGKNELGVLYKTLSKEFNPVQLADDFTKIAPSVSNSIKQLAEANRNYSSLMSKYERAMDYFFTKNVRDEFIPSIQKAVSAIKSNNLPLIREMRIADEALPVKDRIFANVKSLVDDTETVITNSRKSIELLKQKALKEKNVLNNAIKKSTNEFQKSKYLLKSNQQTTITQSINNFTSKQDERYYNILKGLNEAENFYKGQDLLREFRPAEKSLARVLQNVTAVGGLATTYAHPTIGIGTELLAGLLSPIAASNVSKVGLNILENLTKKGTPIIKNRILQQLVGKELIKRKD